MSPTAFASYAATLLGGLTCLSALFLAVIPHIKRSSGKEQSKSLIAMLLGAGLLFVFGGGWGLAGLETASQVLKDLVSVIHGKAGSPEHQGSVARLMDAARYGKLSADELAILRTALLDNPPDNAEAVIGSAANGASGEAKVVLGEVRAEIAMRTRAAVESVRAEATKPGGSTDAAIRQLAPEQLRYLRAAPDVSLRSLSVNREVVREALKNTR